MKVLGSINIPEVVKKARGGPQGFLTHSPGAMSLKGFTKLTATPRRMRAYLPGQNPRMSLGGMSFKRRKGSPQ